MKPLVLASSSTIRREIISKYDVPVICETPSINEAEVKENSTLTDPIKLSCFLAEAKAKSLSTKYPENIILGCDQICVFNNDIFEKPLKEIIDHGFRIKYFRNHSDLCLAGEDKEFIKKFMTKSGQTIFKPALAEDIFSKEDYIK